MPPVGQKRTCLIPLPAGLSGLILHLAPGKPGAALLQ